MAEPSAFDRENSKLQPLGPPPGLLDQFNLPPAFVAFVRRNRRPLSIVAVFGLALALGISGYSTYRDHRAGKAATALDAALAYIADRPGIWEVILTGGDPLVLSPRRLAELMARLAAIDHVKVVRIHTRVPAVDPDAVTPWEPMEAKALERLGG